MADPRVHDIYFRSATEIEGALENQVSKGGWFIVCDDPEPRGQPIKLRFHLPGLAQPFEVLGEVAFAAPKSAPVPGLGCGMAIQFQRLSPQVLKAFAAAATIARSEVSQPRPTITMPETPPAAAEPKKPEPSSIPVSAPATITEKVSAAVPAAAPAARPAGMAIGKLKLNLNGSAANGAAPAGPPAAPAAPAKAAEPEADEWKEEPDENWPNGPGEGEGADGSCDEDSLEDTGPTEGPVVEPDEAQQRKILASINTQNTENLYGTLRQMPFHQKVVAAKRGNRSVRAILIQEGNQKILNFLLQNPQITVPEILTVLKTPTVSYDVIQTIAKNAAWVSSEEVKYMLVTHPKSPLPLTLNLLPSLNINSLAKLAKGGALKAQLKSNALKLLEQRRKSS